jgi:hypothetical protein
MEMPRPKRRMSILAEERRRMRSRRRISLLMEVLQQRGNDTEIDREDNTDGTGV